MRLPLRIIRLKLTGLILPALSLTAFCRIEAQSKPAGYPLRAFQTASGAGTPYRQPAASDTAISQVEVAARRAALAERIGDGVVLAFGAREPVSLITSFRQLPSFRYLTELDEADHALVMVVRDKKAASTLFLTPVGARTAFYNGSRLDSAAIAAKFGLPSRPFKDLNSVIDSLAQTGLPFYHIPDIETMDNVRSDTLTRGQETVKALKQKFPSLSIRDAQSLVLQLRAKKSETEQYLIRRAAEISAQAHRATMLAPEPRHEYELRAILEYEFTNRGAERPSYGSIVGGGFNSTVLHYMKDMAPVKPGDVVVMDAGAEYRGYAADITRTIPVSGKFTTEQRQIYQLVLDAQKAAERASQPGMSVRAATDSSVAVRARGLAVLGLIESEDALLDPPWPANCERTPSSCRQSTYWMIHGISHGIGLDVHDPIQGAVFQKGDAFTIEPGIYISTHALDVLPDTPRNRAFKSRVSATVRKYQNTGVRIEDDYIITDKGLERITSSVPRELSEIEALMKNRRRR